MSVWSETCFIIDTLERHGAQKQLLLMARRLQERGLPPFTLIVFREPLTLWRELEAAGVKVLLVRKRKEIDPAFLFTLVRELRKLRPRIVVTFLISPDIWGRLAALFAGVPVIGSSVRDLPRPHGRFKDLMLLAMDRISAFIVCNSNKSAEVTLMNSNLAPSKVRVIYNGIEPAAEAATTPLAPAEPGVQTVGLVARLFPAKDIGTLLRAVARISGDIALRIVIVGDGPLRGALQQEAQDLGIAERVLFLGERPDAKHLMNGFDIGVLTSIYEGLSNSVMELMLAGKPVLASAVGGNPELVDDGVTGYLFRPGDHTELSLRLSELLLAPEKGKQMGGEGRRRMLCSYSVAAMVETWESLLTEVSVEKPRVVQTALLSG